MARSIATSEPEKFLAGETVKWTKSLSEFTPAEGAVLKYSIRGAQKLDITCTTSGADFLATLTAAQTAALNTGTSALTCWWQSYVELSGERFKIADGQFTVDPDLSDINAAYDGRSHAKTMLDALESLSEGKASLDQKQLMIGDRQITRLTPKELTDWTEHYRAKYESELRKWRRDNGLSGNDRKVLLKFT
jgi:hypothetical protein